MAITMAVVEVIALLVITLMMTMMVVVGLLSCFSQWCVEYECGVLQAK
jgi:hypothetical protein